MEFAPVETLMHTLIQETSRAPEGDSLAAKNQKFAEEATFFASFFKDRPVRPMPDQPLMMILQKRKLKKKERSVTKKENIGQPHMRRRKKEESGDGQNDNDQNAS